MSNKVSKTVEGNLNRSGRPKGVGNKSTGMAREAIARFVDANAHKMEEWLVAVSNGVQDEETKKWLVPPNPEKAFGMLQSVMEYHLPKLARSEHTTPEDEPIRHIHEHSFLD
jgi:hypothetical protein